VLFALVKLVVFRLQVLFNFVSNNKGNYFVGFTAVIAALPSLFDEGNLLRGRLCRQKRRAGGEEEKIAILGRSL
jgi:hypothetical protein